MSTVNQNYNKQTVMRKLRIPFIIRICDNIPTAAVLLFAIVAPAATPWNPVYETHFSTDPSWATSDPSTYYWNAESGTYALRMADASSSYATFPVSLVPRQSLKFEFDVKISGIDWAGDICLGMYGAGREAYRDCGPHPYLKLNFGRGDLGHGLFVDTFDSSGIHREIDQYPSPWAFDTWYHTVVVFDHDASTITVEVTRKSDNQPLWSDSMTCVQIMGDFKYFGASKICDDYAPGATGTAVIDNVSVSQPDWVPLFASDFQTDPGITTSDPGSYHLNAGVGTYSLTMVDASDSYATVPIALSPRESFKFEFDINISQMDWAGDICLGLFGATRHAYFSPDPHPYVKINFGSGDLGHGLFVDGFDALNTHWEIDQYPSPWAFDTWYRASVVFDQDAGAVTVRVTRKSDCQVIWSRSLSGVRGLGPLVYFGASKIHDDYAPGATGVATIDNVALFSLLESPPAATIRVSQVEICWPSRTNSLYNLQYNSNLTPNTWIDLVTNIVGDPGQTCVQDNVPPGSPARFYRVQVLQK
jgi:hypothetical protein